VSETFERVLSPELATLPRGRHNLTREQVRSTQRTRMLLAMVEAVAEKGYVNTSVADVIGGARASRETFYEHFENKQDCFLAAYDEAVRRLTEMMRRALLPGDAPAVRFERALEAYLDAIASQPGLGRTFLIEVYAAGPEAWERRAQVMDRVSEVIFELLREDPAIALLPDPRFAARALVGAIIMMVTGLVAAGDYAALPALTAPIMELLRALTGGLTARELQ
jgi:AcrR family transcriptional regulator